MLLLKALVSALLFFVTPIMAGPPIEIHVLAPLNFPAISMFLLFVAATLFVTYWAAKRTKTAKDFYTAGGGITGLQNGLAISGDYLSAASFLGITAAVYLNGYDGLIFAIGFLVGWPIVLFLMVERLRNLGEYSFTDVAAYRFQQKPVRLVMSISSVVVVFLYLIAQMVGAGALIETLFGFDYVFSVILVGALMISYVVFGGMLATTWVQIIKAILLLSGASFMAFMVMLHFNFSFDAIFAEAINKHPASEAVIFSGSLVSDPINTISLAIALMFGIAGLPHILMRFFTVPDAKEARKSIFFATTFIGYFYILAFIIGFGAIAFVMGNPNYFDSDGNMLGGSNMPAIHLAHAIGGDLFLGFISAVAFATILAVVSGLTLAGASAISHDFYARVVKPNASQQQEIKVTKLATVLIGMLAILVGIAFKEQNVAFVVALAFTLAASTIFPILILSMYWQNMTTRGAVIGGWLGLIVSVLMVILGPVVWTQILQLGEAIVPYQFPAVFTVSISFVAIWWFSMTDKTQRAQQDKMGFEAQFVISQIGVKSEKSI